MTIRDQLQRVAYVMFKDGWQSKEVAPLAFLEITALRARVSTLEAELEKAREALEPFAVYAENDGFGLDNNGQPLPDADGPGWVYLTNGDFRRASGVFRSLSHKEG